MNRSVFIFLAALTLAACNTQPLNNSALPEPGFASPRKVEMNPPHEPLPVDESIARFRLPKGYRLEIVAAEPMISEPVAIAWDGNGVMYVAQLETYMQTIDAQGQDEPRSRIMRLEDTDNDGRMDKSTVFADSLLSPRMILCVGTEVLVNETNTFDILAYKDEDGDGVADKKRTVYSQPMKAYGNVEHQRTGLDWNIDNRIYVTTDLVSFKYKNGMLEADSMRYGNNGQWGLTHDDYGRIYFSRAASSVAASGFHINPLYGHFDIFDRKEDSIFRMVWPGVKTPDANARLRDDSTLIEFTSSCGQAVYRGDQLPSTIQGDYFACEPVGRVVRRAKITAHDGVISVKNAYNQDEFITTSDVNFRPVNTYTGPDGYLYIVDMYRGIIQEATWVQPKSKLYNQIKSKQLDKNIRRGRIYRLVHEGSKRDAPPKMLEESTAALVNHLKHKNGWWRDNAQKELIVRNDVSVVSDLKKLFNDKSENEITRLHALWTIDGLGKSDNVLAMQALEDKSPQIRKAGIRIAESLLPGGGEALKNALLDLRNDSDKEVLAQLVLTLNNMAHPAANEVVSNYEEHRLFAAIKRLIAENEEKKKFGSRLVALKEPIREGVIRGAGIFNSLCANCHGPKGEGLPSKIAPPLIGKFKLVDNKNASIKILLHGLTGPVEGVTYPDNMMSMKSYDDEWIASVLNYVRFDLGMQSFPELPNDYLHTLMITPEEVKKIREENKDRHAPWTWEELLK